MATQSYQHGTGKRKCAIAQVKIFKGSGEIIVNGKPYQQRFPVIVHRNTIEKPFRITENMGKFNAEVKIHGGGVTGQAQAIAYGISKALLKVSENNKNLLRQAGLLTRDARIKERKKYGLKRARKAPQYTKR